MKLFRFTARLTAKLTVGGVLLFLVACSCFQKTEDNTVTRVLPGERSILKQAKKLEALGVLVKASISEPDGHQVTVTGPRHVVGCLANNGQWLNKYQECENVSEQSCKVMGGTFNSCASACRHQSLDILCIQMCVPVCQF